jgi:hypothetical protein
MHGVINTNPEAESCLHHVLIRAFELWWSLMPFKALSIEEKPLEGTKSNYAVPSCIFL